MEAAREDLRADGPMDGAGRTAADLGAGLGAHAVAMAESGYGVTAIDTCVELLLAPLPEDSNLAEYS